MRNSNQNTRRSIVKICHREIDYSIGRYLRRRSRRIAPNLMELKSRTTLASNQAPVSFRYFGGAGGALWEDGPRRSRVTENYYAFPTTDCIAGLFTGPPFPGGDNGIRSNSGICDLADMGL